MAPRSKRAVQEMERRKAVGARVLRSRLELGQDLETKVSQDALGLLVARKLGLAKAITGATVSRWESGASSLDLATVEAIGSVCRVDPCWLAFGGGDAPLPIPRGLLERLAIKHQRQMIDVIADQSGERAAERAKQLKAIASLRPRR